MARRVEQSVPGQPGLEPGAMMQQVGQSQQPGAPADLNAKARGVDITGAICLAPRKGTVQMGADADPALVDLGRTMRIDDHALHSRWKISP